MCRGHARVLRGGWTSDRLVSDVRVLPIRGRAWPNEARSTRVALFRGQGVDVVGWSAADRGDTPPLAGAVARSRAGAQSPLLGGAAAGAVRDEGREADPLRRHHDVGRTPAPR